MRSLYALELVAVVVEYQHALVGALKQIVESLGLCGAHGMPAVLIVIHRTGRILDEFVGKGHRCRGYNLATVSEFLHTVLLELSVVVNVVELDFRAGINQVRKLYVVLGPETDADVGNLGGYLLLGSRAWYPVVHHGSRPCPRAEIGLTVVTDELAEPLAAVEQLDLCPEVHQTVRCWRACELDEPTDLRTHCVQSAEAFCPRILEAGRLVQNHAVERPFAGAPCILLHQVDYVVTVGHVYVGLSVQSLAPLSRRAHDYRHPQAAEVVPLAALACPCVAGNGLRGHDQRLAHLGVAVDEDVQSGQGDDALAKTHLGEQGAVRVGEYVLDHPFLVCVRSVLHSGIISPWLFLLPSPRGVPA